MDQLIRSILDLSISPLSRHSCRVTTTPRLGRAELRSVAAGIAGMALVGGSVGISRTLVAAPLLTAQAIRYCAASAVLLMLARCCGARITRPRGWEWLWLAGVSATGLVLFNIAIVRGVARTGPAMIAVAVACVPVLLGVLGPLLLRRAPRWQVVLAAVIVVAGAVLVEGTGRADAAGVAWAAVALACEASFTLLAVPVLARHGAWGVSVHSVWIGAAMLIVLSGGSPADRRRTRGGGLPGDPGHRGRVRLVVLVSGGTRAGPRRPAHRHCAGLGRAYRDGHGQPRAELADVGRHRGRDGRPGRRALVSFQAWPAGRSSRQPAAASDGRTT